MNKAKNKRVYIVHGYMASPTDHWFPWLKEKLELDGVKVEILAMPNSANPDVRQWNEYLEECISVPDETTYFVGHSLGSISVLNYLSGLNGAEKIGGIILVAGFAEPLPSLPELDGFTKNAPTFEKIIKMSSSREVILSTNDEIVPPKFTENLASKLETKPVKIESGGHFLGREGFKELSIVYEKLNQFFGL